MEKYFNILEISPTATIIEIKHAYKKKIESLHINKNDTEAETKEIVDAYNNIMNHYDEYQKILQGQGKKEQQDSGKKQQANIQKTINTAGQQVKTKSRIGKQKKPHIKQNRNSGNLLKPKFLEKIFYHIRQIPSYIESIPILGGLIKILIKGIFFVIITLLALLILWCIICIIIKNSVPDGVNAFIHGKFLGFIINWYVKSFGYLTRGDMHGVLIGLLRIFAPLPLLGVIVLMLLGAGIEEVGEFSDTKGNKYTITKK
ncbi:J domain-containing protein [Treponema primitia]|uniref:J domain-containing protein n=1 Tax=Treponema primitia TaxID=88058 RepID=UPI003980F9A8